MTRFAVVHSRNRSSSDFICNFFQFSVFHKSIFLYIIVRSRRIPACSSRCAFKTAGLLLRVPQCGRGYINHNTFWTFVHKPAAIRGAEERKKGEREGMEAPRPRFLQGKSREKPDASIPAVFSLCFLWCFLSQFSGTK
jgi:hypothetical protein